MPSDVQGQAHVDSPTSDVMNAKWHAGTSTRVLINPNQKHVLKIVL